MIETRTDCPPPNIRILADDRAAASRPVRPRALVVAADPFLARPIAGHLERGGFETAAVIAGEDALREIAQARPHVIFLHAADYDSAVLALCRQVRAVVSTPIIVCSTSRDVALLVDALGAGADDVFVMPLSAPEFVARVRAVLRRAQRAAAGPPAERLLAGDIEVRPFEYRAYRKGGPLNLSPTEFRLLTALVRHSGRTVSHRQLLARACGEEYADAGAILRIYIRRLRARLGDAALITSVRGEGYRLRPALPATLSSSAA